MFLNIYKYGLKINLKDKATIFWLLLWPLILATLFNLCFSNLLNGESFEKIDVAIVKNESMPSDFLDIVDETDMFITTLTDRENADELLSTGKIDAIINYKDSDNIELFVNKSGMGESITKIFLDSYLQMTKTITTIVVDNPELLATDFLSNIKYDESYIKDMPIGKSTNITVIYFYSLIAMTCLLSSTLGSDVVTRIQANQSYIAARINVAPTHKMKSFFALMCSSMTFHMLSVIITLVYLIYFLGIDFGSSMGYIILICLVGSFAGFAMGALVSALIIKRENIKMAINLTITLFGCFLAGMMAVDMKYIIQSKFPVISYINPANLITDGLYTLYYYSTLDRYFINVIILFVMGVVFSLITYLILRRQKYASI